MKFITAYLDWHYLSVWWKLLILWRNLTLFPFYYFSIPLHIRTLFSLWKRQRVNMRRGFHLDDFIYVTGFNFISRILGTIIRSFTVIYGLLLMVFGMICGLIPVLIWVLIPGISLIFYLTKSPYKEEEANYILKRANRNLRKLVLLLFRHEEGRFIATHLGYIYPKLIALFSKSPKIDDFDGFKNSIICRGSYLKFSDIFEALARTYPPLVQLLEESRLKSEDVRCVAEWYETVQENKSLPLFFDLRKIKSLPGIGCEWAYGYTVVLDEFSQDLNHKTSAFPLLIARDKEIADMEQILLRSEKNNVLVVGESGSSRHILVETLAHRIRAGDCPPALSHKRVILMKMHSLLSAASERLEVKGLLDDILDEAKYAGNIILVIDEIDKYLTSGNDTIDLSDVFVTASNSNIRIIGITTPKGFHKNIKPNPVLKNFFDTIEINPLSKELAFEVLKYAIVPYLEEKYSLTITYQAIKKTLDDADRYISSTPFPAKGVELLEEASVFLTSRQARNILFAHDIDDFLSEKFQVQLGDLQKGEKERLVHLENLIHKRIINQEEAVKSICTAIRRRRLDISSANKPAGTFLFLGPTGVGKTETAKALASVYYQSEERIIRLDMSQYQKEEGMDRLIGSAKSGLPGELVSQLSDNPFSLLLLDEFEKADKQIYNLFLTLFDEGYIADGEGEKINAKNTIVIATSNAGAEYIREQINMGVGGVELKNKVIDFVQSERIFSPELLNRFDAVVVFSPLSEGHLREVARLQLESLNQRLKTQEISVSVTSELVRKLAGEGLNPQFGARAMKRVIAERVEDIVAQKILSGQVVKGDSITIDL